MHFQNGRPAKEADPIIFRVPWLGRIIVGTIYNLRPGETCNCDVAVLVPGGVQQFTCQNVQDMYHAEDAIAAIEATQPKPAPVPEPDVFAAAPA